jgi:hypothetical protein
MAATLPELPAKKVALLSVLVGIFRLRTRRDIVVAYLTSGGN